MKQTEKEKRQQQYEEKKLCKKENTGAQCLSEYGKILYHGRNYLCDRTRYL